MGAESGPSATELWLESLDKLERIEKQEAQQQPSGSKAASYAVMLGWGVTSTLALGSGLVVGYRSFDGSIAYEALDHKAEKPTVAAEAQASRMAGRALGVATAMVLGSAGMAVLGLHMMGIRSAADLGKTAKLKLEPVNDWLNVNGNALSTTADGAREALDGVCDSMAERWRRSYLGGAIRKRIESGSDRGDEPSNAGSAAQ